MGIPKGIIIFFRMWYDTNLMHIRPGWYKQIKLKFMTGFMILNKFPLYIYIEMNKSMNNIYLTVTVLSFITVLYINYTKLSWIRLHVKTIMKSIETLYASKWLENNYNCNIVTKCLMVYNYFTFNEETLYYIIKIYISMKIKHIILNHSINWALLSSICISLRRLMIIIIIHVVLYKRYLL